MDPRSSRRRGAEIAENHRSRYEVTGDAGWAIVGATLVVAPAPINEGAHKGRPYGLGGTRNACIPQGMPENSRGFQPTESEHKPHHTRTLKGSTVVGIGRPCSGSFLNNGWTPHSTG